MRREIVPLEALQNFKKVEWSPEVAAMVTLIQEAIGAREKTITSRDIRPALEQAGAPCPSSPLMRIVLGKRGLDLKHKGRRNDGGMIYTLPGRPFTDEFLAQTFNGYTTCT